MKNKRPDLVARKAEHRDELYTIAFGENLYLFVSPTAKYWRGRFMLTDESGRRREKSYSMGQWPELGYTAARQEWDWARELVKRNIDPNVQRRIDKAQVAVEIGNTFRALADDYLEYTSGFLAEATVERNRSVLELHVYPELGHLPVGEVTVPMLVQLARRVERKTPETARRVLILADQIYRHAEHSGLVSVNVGAAAKGCLRPYKKGHYPAILDPLRLGEFMVAVMDWRRSVPVETLLRITWHLAQRGHDVRHMEWAGLDLDSDLPVWTFVVRKSGEKHSVPLSPFVVGELRRLREFTESEHRLVFPGQRSMEKPLSDMTIPKVIRDLGFGGEITPHASRAVFRTLAEEQLRISPYELERVLAHAVGSTDRLRGAYARSDLLAARREVMAEWSSYLLRLERGARERLGGGNVVAGHFAAESGN